MTGWYKKQSRPAAAVFLVPLLLLSVSAFAQERPELSDYITGLEKGDEEEVSSIAGMPVRDVSSDETGVLVELDADGIPVRLALIGEIEAKRIEPALRRLRREVLAEDVRITESRTVEITDVLVSVGRNGALFVDLEVSRLEIRLDERMLLDFAKRLSSPINLRSHPGDSRVSSKIPLEGIDIPAKERNSFPGWKELERQLRNWARQGIDRNDQHVMGIILEIRRFEEGEIEQEKKIVFEPPEEEHWANLHFSLETSVPNMAVASAGGVDIGIPSIMVQPLLCMEFFGLGGDEVFRPFSTWLYLGPFADVRLYSMLYEEYDDLYQILPAGVTFSAGFSGYYPRIKGNRLTGRAFGLGGEVQVKTNVFGLVAGRSEEGRIKLAGEYLMDITPAFVLHMLPDSFKPWDITVGLPLKIFSNENTGSWELYSLGLSLGVRMRFPLKEFYRREN